MSQVQQNSREFRAGWPTNELSRVSQLVGLLDGYLAELQTGRQPDRA